MWHRIDNEGDVYTPALLVYHDRIERNIRKMIDIAGDVNRIRPHVKTHKMPEIIRLQMKYGINKFKCATISEAEMAARCGASDILLAYQPVGPNQDRFFRLKKEYDTTRFSCIADSEAVIRQLSGKALINNTEAGIWLDINNGMNRTGVPPGENAIRLFRMIRDMPGLHAEGLHVYDGHIHEPDFSLRKKLCDDSFAPVEDLIAKLKVEGITHIPVIAGGTPTFPIHATRSGVETSPGTLLLWDYGYSSSFTDMDFLHSAVLLMRIISKPGKNLFCLDLGTKAVASEMPQPRIKISGLEDYTIVTHNEEHMVIRTSETINLAIGDTLYGIPWHICPTVDRFDSVYVVSEGKVTDQWKVEARTRRISI